MGIPRVEVTTRTVLTQGTYVPAQPGYEGAIVIQSQKGRLEPYLCNSVSDFLAEYTINGAIPTDQTENTSAYLSAITFLSQSGSPLWVKRAVPVDTLYASGLFLEYTSPASIMDTTEGTFADGVYSDTVDPGIATGTRVTVYGDIPSAYLGFTGVVTVEESLPNYNLSLWKEGSYTWIANVITVTSKNHGKSATNSVTLDFTSGGASLGVPSKDGPYTIVSATTDTYTVACTGSGDSGLVNSKVIMDDTWETIYFLNTEYGVSEGVDDIESIGVVNGYSIFAKNPGAWGNNVAITVEVPKLSEEGISALQSVRFEASEIPVTEDWAMDASVAVPVKLFKASSTDVLPTGIGDSDQYYVTAAASGGTDLASVFEIVDGSLALVEMTAAGSGNMIVAPIGSIVTVSVNLSDDTILDIDGGSVVQELAGSTRCFVVPSESDPLPDGISEGVLYYATYNTGSVTLSETSGGAAISITPENTDDTFFLYVILYAEEGVSRDMTITEATITQNIPIGTPVEINGDSYYIYKTDPNALTVSIVEDYADVFVGVEYATLVDFPTGEDDPFDITPINDFDQWENQYEVISLDGRVDYVDNTILLNELEGGGYQGWVPGELVRFIAASGSTLPGGVTQYSRYRVLPVGGGKVKIASITGSVLTDVSYQATAVDFTTIGSGTFTFASGNASLFEDTFRVNVWKIITSSGTTSYSNVETFVCSLYRDKQDEAGRSIYIEDRLASSAYVGGASSDVESVPRGTLQLKPVPALLVLAGGDSGNGNTGEVTTTVLTTALQDLSDPLQYSFNYLLDGGFSGGDMADYQNSLVALAEVRRCFAFLSTPEIAESADDPATEIAAYSGSIGASSYGALFGPWQLAIDATSGSREVMAPPDGFVAAKHARIDRSRGVGTPVAGVETGGISSRGGRISFSRSGLDDMYDAGINPLIQVQGVGGTVIWGNKTLLNAASPLAEIHVQKMDNAITTDLSNLLLRYVQVNITPSLYEAITNTCTSYMNTYVTRGVLNTSTDGSPSFIVICNASNNTEQDKDSGLVNVEVAYKPVRSSKYVRLYTTVTPGGVSFESIQLS